MILSVTRRGCAPDPSSPGSLALARSTCPAPRRSVLDDVRPEAVPGLGPGTGVEPAVSPERVGRGPAHRQRVVGVVGHEQALAAEGDQPRVRRQPQLDASTGPTRTRAGTPGRPAAAGAPRPTSARGRAARSGRRLRASRSASSSGVRLPRVVAHPARQLGARAPCDRAGRPGCRGSSSAPTPATPGLRGRGSSGRRTPSTVAGRRRGRRARAPGGAEPAGRSSTTPAALRRHGPGQHGQRHGREDPVDVDAGAVVEADGRGGRDRTGRSAHSDAPRSEVGAGRGGGVGQRLADGTEAGAGIEERRPVARRGVPAPRGGPGRPAPEALTRRRASSPASSSGVDAQSLPT